MVHIAMPQNDDSGSPVAWGEHVGDEQYGGGSTAWNPTYDFNGQVALVTGAGAGMGLDTARAFAAAGAAVVLADVDEDALRAATDELTAAGHQALGVTCDVADEDQVAALVDRTVDEFGRLDMAFNNAGIMLPLADAADEPAESFDRVSAINLRGVWACMKHELRQMRAQGSGAIVNCSSLGGLVGNPGRAVLPRHQARRPRPHQERRAGVRAARHPRQRRLPRHDRDPDGRRHGRQGRARRSPTPSPASRSAASGAETRSPPPCCGCAARERASCSASRCPSTAATPPAERPRQEVMTTMTRSALDARASHALATRSSSRCSPPCRSRRVAAQTRTATRPPAVPRRAHPPRRRPDARPPAQRADGGISFGDTSSPRGCTTTPRHAISPPSCR